MRYEENANTPLVLAPNTVKMKEGGFLTHDFSVTSKKATSTNWLKNNQTKSIQAFLP